MPSLGDLVVTGSLPCKKVKVVFIQRSIQSVGPLKALYTFCPPLPGRPVDSDTNSASPGSILAMQQLRATTKSLTFPPLSIAGYSFKQLSELGHQWRERKWPILLRVRHSTAELPRSTNVEQQTIVSRTRNHQ